MNDRVALSLAFIDRKPQAAARVLNALPVAEAAAYLDAIPGRHAVAVLGHTGPWSAARLLVAMSRTAASSVLVALPYLDAVAILRVLGPGERAPLLGALPRRLCRSIETTMAYPSDTVGGQMATDIVIVGARQTVEDAASALRDGPAVDRDILFVTGSKRSFVGALPPARLFRHGSAIKLSEIMDSDLVPLSARQTVGSAAGHEGWRRFHWLPVVGRLKNLVGALSMDRLQADRAPDSDRTRGRSEGMLPAMTSEYAAFGASLFELLDHGRRRGEHTDSGGASNER